MFVPPILFFHKSHILLCFWVTCMIAKWIPLWSKQLVFSFHLIISLILNKCANTHQNFKHISTQGNFVAHDSWNFLIAIVVSYFDITIFWGGKLSFAIGYKDSFKHTTFSLIGLFFLWINNKTTRCNERRTTRQRSSIWIMEHMKAMIRFLLKWK